MRYKDVGLLKVTAWESALFSVRSLQLLVLATIAVIFHERVPKKQIESG